MMKKIFGFLRADEPRPSLGELASFYGLERRKTVRVLYPPTNHGLVLPMVQFEDFRVRVKDISEGGFCLCSNALTEQLSVGQDYEFELCWDHGKTKAKISAKHIAVSFEKLHFQFHELESSVQERLKSCIEIAKRGLSVKSSFVGVNSGIQSDIKEIWVNSYLDKFVVNNSDDSWIEADFLGERIVFAKTRESLALDQQDIAKLMVFLSNVPSPSEDINLLLKWLGHSMSKKESA